MKSQKKTKKEEQDGSRYEAINSVVKKDVTRLLIINQTEAQHESRD